jgi:hypothetical protein
MRHFMDWFEQATSATLSPTDTDSRDLQDWRNQAEMDFKPAIGENILREVVAV